MTETRQIIQDLRQSQKLSQDEFAAKLFVTRQAVSRWENGETIPNTDTLKLMAEIFQVSVDYLLGRPAGICQSCGMNLEKDIDKGTEQDGQRSEEYCSFCYQNGAFVHDDDVDEMIEHNLKTLEEWNREMGLHLTIEEARRQLKGFLPTLKRWR